MTMFRRPYSIVTAGVAGLLCLSLARAQEPPPVGQPPGGTQASADYEVYNRGPLHEAFATPGTIEPVRGQDVDREPPEPIDEVPPEQRPEGDNVEWIPGYWSFDEELDDFLWVSGVWRDIPPSRTWVPGYWNRSGRGYQWVAGMWAAADVDQVAYLPEPPASQERGPSSPSPGDGYFWVPGSWEYYDTDYRWRPGYWAPHQRDWIWVPSCYNYTPRGYVHVPGYWDYQLAYRGVAFAPIYFHNHAYGRPFAPTVALDSWGNLMLHLFVQPTYGRYYFGNYYGPRYAGYGFTPFYSYHGNHGYDPLFVYFNWRYGGDYYNRLDGWHRYFATHDDLRPRQTYREQREFFDRNRDNRVVAATTVAESLENMVQSRDVPVAFASVNDQQRQRFTEQARNLREFTRERSEVEAQPSGGERPEGRERTGLRIRGNERLQVRTDEGRAQQRQRVEAPERPDQMRDVRPDDRDGQRARVPSPQTRERGTEGRRPEPGERERPDVREQPGRQPDQPDTRDQPGRRERPGENRQPERRGPRDLPQLPEGPGDEGNRPDRGAGSPPERGQPPRGQQPPERGQQPRGQQPRGQQQPERGQAPRGQQQPEREQAPRGQQPPERGGQPDRGAERPERGAERPERGAERPERGAPDRGQGGRERGERPERGGQPDRGAERPERDTPDRGQGGRERGERPERGNRGPR